MTAADKKIKRKLRHEIMAKARKHAFRRIGLFSRDAQLKAAARVLTDRFIAAAKAAQLSQG